MLRLDRTDVRSDAAEPCTVDDSSSAVYKSYCSLTHVGESERVLLFIVVVGGGPWPVWRCAGCGARDPSARAVRPVAAELPSRAERRAEPSGTAEPLETPRSDFLSTDAKVCDLQCFF